MLRRHTHRIVIAGLALVAVLSMSAFYLDQQSGAAATSARQLINRTYVIERAFQNLGTAISEAESDTRGFLLTGDARHLEAFDQRREQAQAASRRLRDVTIDDAVQKRRVDALVALAERKVAQLQSTVGFMTAGQREQAMASVRGGRGDQLLDDIKVAAGEARQSELGLLASRQRRFDDAIDQRLILRRVLLASSLVVTLAAFYFALRLNRLESFTTMCAWSRTIQMDGRWVTFEEYLSQRFNVRVSHGIAPKELEKLIAQIEREEDETGPQPVPTKSTTQAA
jgi:CHASE3 domain sensor protein